jgi:hypothetical protein
MMSKIIDTRSIVIEKARILFDTNVWILINGFGGNSAQNRATLYSAAYKLLLNNDNTVVLNNYILGEFFNRCTKLEYEIIKNDIEAANGSIPHFKAYRRSPEFAPVLEGIRDTCLNMLDDCEFISVEGHHYDIRSIVNDCASECADFSDLVLIEFCKLENLCMMTDDADFSQSGLDIITANKKMLHK